MNCNWVHFQQALQSSLQDDNNFPGSNSNISIAAIRQNPVDGLVEEAMQNYTQIDNPATLQLRKKPQTTRADQTSNGNVTQAHKSRDNRGKITQAPQE
jgi:hypothetical protein